MQEISINRMTDALYAHHHLMLTLPSPLFKAAIDLEVKGIKYLPIEKYDYTDLCVVISDEVARRVEALQSPYKETLYRAWLVKQLGEVASKLDGN